LAKKEVLKKGVNKEVLLVGRKPKEITLTITHTYVHNPEAVERGLELWASYLARHMAKRLTEEAQNRHQGTA
jgi:hypothetical protein